MFGTTTNSLRKNLGWARRAIVSFSYVPLDLITVLALFVVVISSVALIFEVVAGWSTRALAPKGFTTVIVVILFIGGIQLLCLAIIGVLPRAHVRRGQGPAVLHRRVDAQPAPGAELPPEVVVLAGSRPGRAPAPRPPPLSDVSDGKGQPPPASHPMRDLRNPDGSDELYRGAARPGRVHAEVFSARRLPDRTHYRMVRCRTCGLVRSDPVLDAEAMAELYRESSFDYGDELEGIRATYGAALDRLASVAARRRKGLLDIGCGSGFVLELARDRGWQAVQGSRAERRCDRQGGPRDSVQRSSRTSCAEGLFELGSFDAVTLFQVLDHIPDPVGVLRDCSRDPPARRCDPGAQPQRDRLSARHPGRERSPIIDVEHTYLYSPETMRARSSAGRL